MYALAECLQSSMSSQSLSFHLCVLVPLQSQHTWGTARVVISLPLSPVRCKCICKQLFNSSEMEATIEHSSEECDSSWVIRLSNPMQVSWVACANVFFLHSIDPGEMKQSLLEEMMKEVRRGVGGENVRLQAACNEQDRDWRKSAFSPGKQVIHLRGSS